MWGAGPWFNIVDYGARNDGSASATAAIRSAIQAAKAAGGGTVYVPAGRYVTGPIELVSNLVLEIDAGAVLQFPASRDGVTYTRGRLEGTECLTPVPLIGGHDLENVTIRGRGTITTDNAQWMSLVRQPEAAAARTVWTGILKALDLKQPVAPEDFLKAAPSLRPSFIRTMESRNILIEGIHIVGSPMWVIHILYSQQVVIRDVIIETYPGVNTDGMDIDSSQDVLISNCYLDTGDDAICLKSGKDADGLRVNRPAEDIVIENSRFHYGHGGVAMGSETSGGIRNVEVRNCVSDSGNWAPIRFKTQPSRSGVVENITYRDMQLKDTRQAFEFNLEWRMVPPIAPPAKVLPVVRNITIRNITGTVNSVGMMHGLVDSPIENVKFENCKIVAQKGFVMENARKVDLSGLTVEVKEGEPIVRRNVQ